MSDSEHYITAIYVKGAFFMVACRCGALIDTANDKQELLQLWSQHTRPRRTYHEMQRDMMYR